MSATVGYVPAITLTPRLVLSLRRLYAQDLQGRHGSDIDTAFGLTSSGDGTAAVSTLVFADGEQDERVERGERQGEEIEMEERTIPSTCGSGV